MQRAFTSVSAGQSPPCAITVRLPKFPQQFPMEKAKFPAPERSLPRWPRFSRGLKLLLALLFVSLLRFVNSQNTRLNKLRIITIMAQFKENMFIFGDQQGATEKRKNTPCGGCAPRRISISLWWVTLEQARGGIAIGKSQLSPWTCMGRIFKSQRSFPNYQQL